MTSQPSGSNGSFDRLHEEIKRWIWQQHWETLREIQDKTIEAVFDSNADILVAATTAAGKTEAAFLPILTQVAEREASGLAVLYISPLKALINDQFRRLDELCEHMGINVVRWHGDAPQSAKARTIKKPSGIALITPESIEALLIRKPAEARKLFSNLDYIIVDELHAFLQGPRGLHLFSLLNRIEAISKKRPRRIGLSATLGDFAQARSWLNHSSPDSVLEVQSSAGNAELKLQIRSYIDSRKVEEAFGIEDESSELHPIAYDRIADHIFDTLRGSNNLVFAGSRKKVETLADRLRRRCENANVPNEFFPHHGNLSKELREDLELRLKKSELPTTGIATTTLELGIDIGSVKSIAQIGPLRSLSSTRQRLGRSGRRKGTAAVLRVYLRHRELIKTDSIIEHLRFDLVQSVAAIRLLVNKFIEPASDDPTVATVMLHQTLSLICEYGGLRADKLFSILNKGQLFSLDQMNYISLLKGMASHKLIEQAADGTIMLGELGEKITTRRDFYAIFETDEEWQIITDGRRLGTIPLDNMVAIGSLIVFAGQRWKVMAVDDRSKVLDVKPHRSAALPEFDPVDFGGIHDRIIQEMRKVYEADDEPLYLDKDSLNLLRNCREAYRSNSLSKITMIEEEGSTHLFLWRGTEFCSLMRLLLQAAGLTIRQHSVGITVEDADPQTVEKLLNTVHLNLPPLEILADFVEDLEVAKYDAFIPRDVLKSMWCKKNTITYNALLKYLT